MHSNHNFISQYFCSVKFFELHYFMEKLANNVNSFFVSACAVDLYNSEHPLILCTDDSGVFSTSVSGEYILASTKFGTSIFLFKIRFFWHKHFSDNFSYYLQDLGPKKMFKLASRAIDFIFADKEVKKELEKIFVSASKELDL